MHDDRIIETCGKVHSILIATGHRTKDGAQTLEKAVNDQAHNFTTDPAYFTAARGLKMERDAKGVLLVTINDGHGGPITFTAKDHTEFTEAFYRIAQDRDTKVVILTGATDYMAAIDFATFGNVADPDVWSQVHDEGVQIVENIANIRVPMIAAVEGRAHIHSEYALMANVIVAGASASFSDLPHFAGGIVPGDGIYTAWSYRAGAGRAEAFLLNPEPISALTAKDWGVVAEVVADGSAVARARELADLYLAKPEGTRRNTRIHFVQPLKEALVRETGYGLALEGASAAALVKSFSK